MGQGSGDSVGHKKGFTRLCGLSQAPAWERRGCALGGPGPVTSTSQTGDVGQVLALLQIDGLGPLVQTSKLRFLRIGPLCPHPTRRS